MSKTKARIGLRYRSGHNFILSNWFAYLKPLRAWLTHRTENLWNAGKLLHILQGATSRKTSHFHTRCHRNLKSNIVLLAVLSTKSSPIKRNTSSQRFDTEQIRSARILQACSFRLCILHLPYYRRKYNDAKIITLQISHCRVENYSHCIQLLTK